MDPGDDILIRVAGSIALEQFDLHVIERIEIGPAPLCSRTVSPRIRPSRRISLRNGFGMASLALPERS
jgi:hypothetical protein